MKSLPASPCREKGSRKECIVMVIITVVVVTGTDMAVVVMVMVMVMGVILRV